mgnify:CR=1 FL=1
MKPTVKKILTHGGIILFFFIIAAAYMSPVFDGKILQQREILN